MAGWLGRSITGEFNRSLPGRRVRPELRRLLLPRFISVFRKALPELRQGLSEPERRACCRILTVSTETTSKSAVRVAQLNGLRGLRSGSARAHGVGGLRWSLADRNPDRRGLPAPPGVPWFADRSSWSAGPCCALNQVQAAVASRSRDIDGIGFHRVALFSRSVLGVLAHGTRDFAQLSLSVGAGDSLLRGVLGYHLAGL